MSQPKPVRPSGANSKLTPYERAIRPFQMFATQEVSGGIVLILATVAALVFANSPVAGNYYDWFKTSVSIEAGNFRESASLLHWINDGLMAVFFLVVGLEIKRELLTGELSTLRQATLPLMAALGGMLVPAVIYFSVNVGGPSASGWGVPMATDIAFALGVLALLGDRVPYGLKVLLAALAIVDDIGAVLVIAVFYSHGVDSAYLVGAGVCLVSLAAANAAGVRSLLVYLTGGVLMWWCVHHSGIHGTVAGVVTAFLVPAKTRIDAKGFFARAKEHLSGFESAESGTRMLSGEHESSLHLLERAIERATTPLQRLQHLAHPWVAFAIVPLFAFANAGTPLSLGQFGSLAGDNMAMGVVLGLVIGKPIGILAFSWIAVRLNLASLPEGVQMPHIAGIGLLGGIGFTMAIFIAGLAFQNPQTLETAKSAILLGSLVSGVAGLGSLYLYSRRTPNRSDTA